jgi:hypothetical protein
MSTDFLAEDVVSPELAAAMMRLAPANPFCTKSYAEAMRAAGAQAWLLGTTRGGRLDSGCYGYLTAGRLNRVLRIPSVPRMAPDDAFWGGLLRFCASHGVTCLELNSFASPPVRIPPLRGEVERQDRCEYVLDLGDPEWERKLRRDHRQRIRKAIQTGMTLRRTASAEACREHVHLMAASIERRRKRGESISGNLELELPHSIVLVEKGAGELFQAVAGDEVLSSGLVLRAAEGAYYYTSGNSPEALKCGASHFLIHSIARVLRDESTRTFNLGGAELNRGLSLFKSRFGATPVSLESATFYLGSTVRRKLTGAARSLGQNGAGLLRWIASVSPL